MLKENAAPLHQFSEGARAAPAARARHAELLTLLDTTLHRSGVLSVPLWLETIDDVKLANGGKRGNPELKTQQAASLSDVESRLERLNQAGAGVFIAVNEITGNRRQKDNVSRIRAVFGEFDDGLPNSFPIEPTFLVESSPNRFHAYWVTSGLTGEDFDAVMARLVADYGSDKNAKDRTRILRLADTLNMKDPERPWLVRFVAESGKAYTREEVLAAFPPIERKRPNTTKQVQALAISAADVARVQDALNAIPADVEYAAWISVGQALHHYFNGDAFGLEMFDAWSQRAPEEYDADGGYSPDAKWATFSNERSDGVTIASLFHLARQHGWQSPEDRANAEATRLAGLHPVLYDQQKKAIAASLGCNAKTLDALVKAKRTELEKAEQPGIGFEPVDPWPEPVDGAALLDELTATLKRYVVLPEWGAETIALWIVFAHAHDAASISPILAYQSPTKQWQDNSDEPYGRTRAKAPTSFERHAFSAVPGN